MTLPRRPRGSDAYVATGFRRFMYDLLTHGLEVFGLYYGQYRAIIVDNEDDSNQGRLIVRCPAVGDTQETRRLAYPKSPAAGDSFGFRFIPPVDSQVWITFEYGKLDMPVWEGAWWGSDQLHDDWQGNPQAGGIISPGGHKITFDDKGGQKSLLLEHTSGSKVHLDNDGNVTVANASGKTVSVGNGAGEAAALGDTLKGLLEELIDAIQQITVSTTTGPSGTPVNAPVFASIKLRLERILSQTVKVK